MGPSGSGKTTLLKTIAGLKGYMPEAGQCRTGGRLALVFQQPLLLDHLTVRENISLPSVIKRKPCPVDEIMQMLGIERLAGHYPFQLSGGQQRRVALARALASPDSAGVLMDEPFTGLDEPLRERILAELQSALDRTGLACILTTHSPFEACMLADRIIFLGHSPATVVGEYTVRLPRRGRIDFLESEEFFHEITNVRAHLYKNTGLSNVDADTKL